MRFHCLVPICSDLPILFSQRGRSWRNFTHGQGVYSACIYITYNLLFLWQVSYDDRQYQQKAGSLEAFQSLVSAVKVIVFVQ